MAKILCLLEEIFAYSNTMEILFDVFFQKIFIIFIVYNVCGSGPPAHMDIQLTQLHLLKRLSFPSWTSVSLCHQPYMYGFGAAGIADTSFVIF